MVIADYGSCGRNMFMVIADDGQSGRNMFYGDS